MSPEAGCEDSGLSVEVWDGAVIPDYVVCFLYLLTQVELGCHYSHRGLWRKPAVAGQPGKLGVAVAGHDDDAAKVRFGFCFVKKRDVYQQPFAANM